ncbi:uncharacterized protein [Acropora muricata]|uniref:uncharacterized protein isoform X2 n=1 Tax=Acropora muricata TaxID=159855 RepID=UPI0034E3FEF9
MTLRPATVLVSIIALYWLPFACASHFRFGSISFVPVDGYSRRLQFAFRLGFRRSSGYSCTESSITNRRLIGSGAKWNAACVNYYGYYSNNCTSRSIGSTGFFCTDYSSKEDWTMGENNFTYTFPSIHDEWRVSYYSCCWISLTISGGSWLVSATVNLSRRADTGKINSSPVSRSPAIIRWQEGCPQSVRIPVEDPDGDKVRCRYATYAESSISPHSFPHGVLDQEACKLSYDGSFSVSGTYAVAMTLEDFPAGTTDFTSVTPFSSVGLQFLVIISRKYGACDDIPQFTGSTPKDGECTEVQIGSAYQSVIEVRVSVPSKRIAEIVTSSPIGMQITSLQYYGGIYFRNVTWYPSYSQVGQQPFCFKAVDSSNLESEYRCITILVGQSNTPRVIIGSRTPTNPISQRGPVSVWFSIQFNRVIKKPSSSSYIRLVLLNSGQTVYKVDTLSVYAAIGSDQITLFFAIPNVAISMRGTYAILIDRGAVVGQGCSYDGPPTPGITSTSYWQFNPKGLCGYGFSLVPPWFSYCEDINECGSNSSSTVVPMPTSASMSMSLSIVIPSWPSSSVVSMPTSAASMSMSLSTGIPSSSVAPYPIPNYYKPPYPWDFRLQIQSNCDQSCTNTYGGFRCSCVNGFRLASDGKTCLDIDECLIANGGCSHYCYNIPGAFYCGCPEGTTMARNNLTCYEAGVDVTCGEANMNVSLDKKTFPYFKVNNLRLRYYSCRATENSTHLLIGTPLNWCGTQVNETRDSLIFWNEIQVDVVVIDFVVTRTHKVNLKFYCTYPRRKYLSISFEPQQVFFGDEAGYGNFTFRMDFYKSGSYLSPYTEYPIQMGLNEYVYVQYSVESGADLVIMAENCRATKFGAFYSWPYYNLIQNGCPTDTTVDFSYNPASKFQRFKFKTFRFFDDYDTVIFHCEVLACYRYAPNTRCARSCLSSKRRRRRDVTRDELGNEESTQKHRLSSGPIKIENLPIEPADKKKSQSEQVVWIGATAGASGALFIAIAVLGVLFVKYRVARRLKNRNKVADLYTAQDEQMSRRNAYIQEDNMMETDGKF